MSENTFFYGGDTRRAIFVRRANGKVTKTINRPGEGQAIKDKKIKQTNRAAIIKFDLSLTKIKQG